MNPVGRRAVPEQPASKSVHPSQRWYRRRGVAGALAGVAVVGIAAAIVAPTGMALAEPPAAVEAQSVFSIAEKDTQDIRVSVEGATVSPVDRGSFDVYVTPTPTPTPTVASVPSKSSSGSSSSGSSGGSVLYTGGGTASEWMAAAGIASSDWGYVDYIVSKESGWSPNATNSSSGACGLVQALPCSKVPGNGYDPVDNLRWATSYAVGRYGSWAGAYSFWINNHWW